MNIDELVKGEKYVVVEECSRNPAARKGSIITYSQRTIGRPDNCIYFYKNNIMFWDWVVRTSEQDPSFQPMVLEPYNPFTMSVTDRVERDELRNLASGNLQTEALHLRNVEMKDRDGIDRNEAYTEHPEPYKPFTTLTNDHQRQEVKRLWGKMRGARYT